MKYKVFVYGTLRPKGSTPSHVLHDYAMYNYGKFPFILKASEKESVVWGNVLTVSEDQLAELDRYEGISSGLYIREKVQVINTAGETTTCFVYVGSTKLLPELIPSGNWDDR